MTYLPQPDTGQYAGNNLPYWIEIRVDHLFGNGRQVVSEIKEWLTANVGDEHQKWELVWAFNLLTQRHGFNVMLGDLKTVMHFKLTWCEYVI